MFGLTVNQVASARAEKFTPGTGLAMAMVTEPERYFQPDWPLPMPGLPSQTSMTSH